MLREKKMANPSLRRTVFLYHTTFGDCDGSARAQIRSLSFTRSLLLASIVCDNWRWGKIMLECWAQRRISCGWKLFLCGHIYLKEKYSDIVLALFWWASDTLLLHNYCRSSRPYSISCTFRNPASRPKPKKFRPSLSTDILLPGRQDP